MVKVYNNSNTTFLLTADDGTQMKVPFKAFSEIEDKFKSDITYRMAMASGAFTVFETAKQGDAAEKNAHKKNNGKPPKDRREDETASTDKGEAENASTDKSDGAE